ncbi:MAG TPA: heterodisulfide reductase-related iron-sulfur binding cluster [Gemmatimonadales bacterium]|nr:heterodisulfide reductase-related iron-sulfur binding cluster [Gemmatimonadales bacterium]
MTDRQGWEGLDTCVHCGFCLQACPTFLATGDEADSPRGRIELMRGLEAGELAPGDPAVAAHLDRCLGCRGCEPVCPSGVRYGQGLEAARALLADRRGVPLLVRAALTALTTAGASRVVYALARMVRATGLPRRLAGWGRVRFAMGMLGASAPPRGRRGRLGRFGEVGEGLHRSSLPQPPPTSPVLLFRGCIMDGLFSHVHDATIRTLQLNGYAVEEVPAQVCCGALHAHAGLRDEARRLAVANVVAFGTGDEPIVVNSAGCGAMLKEYGHLVAGGKDGSGAGTGAGARFAARVRDVTELLADRGPRPGAPLDTTVAYDPPCHLLHAQRIADPPERVLRAIPVLRLTSMPDAAQCCGSAGLFTLVEPEMSREVLAPKIAALAQARPQVVATGNPGCLMQLGAGLAAARVPAVVRHPVELLDESYRAAGYYA